MGAVSCHWLRLAGGCGIVGDEEGNLVGTCRNKRCSNLRRIDPSIDPCPASNKNLGGTLKQKEGGLSMAAH